MVRNAEYAKLTLEVYRGTAPQGWENLGVKLPPTAGDSGFYAAAYRNMATGEIVIAFRGTELPDDLGDLTADAAVATDGEHQQFVDALEFARQIYEEYDQQSYTVTVTGHSLGGGLAQLAADVFGWDGVTFEAPGVGQLRDNQQFVDWFAGHAGEGLSFGHINGGFNNIVVAGSPCRLG